MTIKEEAVSWDAMDEKLLNEGFLGKYKEI
jgi:hypothetical protein